MALDTGTPFQRHIGERIVSIRERWEPRTGRVGLQIGFESGGVARDAWAGDLRLLPRAAERPRPSTQVLAGRRMP